MRIDFNTADDTARTKMCNCKTTRLFRKVTTLNPKFPIPEEYRVLVHGANGQDLSDTAIAESIQMQLEKMEAKSQIRESRHLFRGNHPGHLLLNDILGLLKEIIQVGNHVDLVEKTISTKEAQVSYQLNKGVENLCYELLSIVAGLANFMKTRDNSEGIVKSMGAKVRLLRAARLERIKALDTFCQQQLAILQSQKQAESLRSIDKALSRLEKKLQDTTTKQTEEIRSEVAHQLQNFQLGVLKDIQSQISTNIQCS